MDQTTAGILALYGILGVTVLALWLRHRSVLSQRDRMMNRMGDLQTNLSDTTQRLDLLSRGVDTILGETPEVRNLLGVHRKLESAENLLFDQGVAVSSSESCAIASHAAKAIIEKHSSESSANASILPGLLPLVVRLDAILTEAEMRAEDLELNGGEHRILGELFHASDRTARAADCYRMANQMDPEDSTSLRSLARIQRESGDLVTLDRTLERLLITSPDDLEALAEQAAILVGSDDDRYDRNKTRLIALGQPLEETESSAKLSEIALRAKDSRISGDMSTLDPTDSPLLVERAAKLILLGEAGAAHEAITRAIEMDEENGPAWLLRARILAAGDGNTNEAIRSIRRATALGEYGVIMESEILENDERLDAARAVLVEHLETSPEDAEARARLSLVLMKAGSIDWAKETLKDAPPVCWESSHMHVMEGRLHLYDTEQYRDEYGNHDPILLIDALISFDAAIDHDRENGLAWLGRSRALRFQGSLNEAEVALVRARRLIPDHTSIPLEEAHLCIEMEKLDQANTHIAEVATHLHDHPIVPFVRGLIAARQGRMTEAQTLFTKVLAIDPNHVRARLNRCSASLLKGDLDLALDDSNYLISISPTLLIARQRRAEVLMNLADWREAEAELRRILDRRDEHVMALVHLGTCLIAMDKAEQAERPLNSALRIDSSNSDAWYQRGLLYLDFGRGQEALSDFESAARNDPRHIDARLMIAAIFHERGDTKNAANAWRKVLDVDPQHKLARRRLEECKGGSTGYAKILQPED
ncbi:MAG: hypothetical protein CMA71_00530 [Euryarchaeota archaeon]|nr:hypothetical protein [Euryarchaeota archaeon]